jgi:hypothetical protein
MTHGGAIPGGVIRPLADMRTRLALAKRDSEAAVFDELLALGEVTLKLAVLGLTAGLRPEYREAQYAAEYALVRADSSGTYVGVLNELVNGQSRHGLDKSAREVQAELTTSVERSSSAWQAVALDAILEVCACLEVSASHKGKTTGRKWFDLLPTVRNRARHGAVTIARKAAAIGPLEMSIDAVIDGLMLFQRDWFYARRQISGRLTTFPLAEHRELDIDPAATEGLTEGIYITFDEPRRVPLLETDESLRDIWIPNGAYNAGRFELLSYSSDSRRSGEGAHYQNPPEQLPGSETQGLGTLEPEGQAFANLPPSPQGYVSRRGLEEEFDALLKDERHPIITLRRRGRQDLPRPGRLASADQDRPLRRAALVQRP